jgi:hypothetical protein
MSKKKLSDHSQQYLCFNTLFKSHNRPQATFKGDGSPMLLPGHGQRDIQMYTHYKIDFFPPLVSMKVKFVSYHAQRIY